MTATPIVLAVAALLVLPFGLALAGAALIAVSLGGWIFVRSGAKAPRRNAAGACAQPQDHKRAA